MVAIQIGLGNSPFWRAVLVRFSVERSPLVIRRREAARFEALQAKSSARHPDRSPSGCYSMPTQVLLDSHHGVTRYDRATVAACLSLVQRLLVASTEGSSGWRNSIYGELRCKVPSQSTPLPSLGKSIHCGACVAWTICWRQFAVCPVLQEARSENQVT